MTYCPNCGKEVKKGNEYCSECGTAIKVSEESTSDIALSEKTNGMALAGFMVSICSFFIGLAGIVPLTSLILSIVGLTQIKKNGEKGKVFAIAGIILSILDVVIKVIIIILYVVIIVAANA